MHDYFRFAKRNGRHIEILLPVSTLTATHFASAHNFHVNWTIGGLANVMSIFKMADVSHVVFPVRYVVVDHYPRIVVAKRLDGSRCYLVWR